ncbi:helix-turn-helix domain-containing protein [Pollutimonas harenae]|uniref:Helix-turn-helix domain-containing protein n=1 Tax=Pollutimonas harenae TaxID=657015 RepID=A0A853GU88_9BURK|nr:helix-turn-helix transcriptional regulator [Pollutimonas harenae]NYT86738.1 helix-turn-helix domain-containing protein [Pollutimonas harenae]TEA71387.1 XRE family transcriptional regulator [Pollutimonas harenae]
MPKKPNKAKTAPAGNKPKQKLVNGINIQINATKVATLKELRKATQHTQDDLAIALGVGQGTISRIEKRDDMLVSTLQHYIESVGGTMQILATFPNNHALIIEQLSKRAAAQLNQSNVKPPDSNSLPAT